MRSKTRIVLLRSVLVGATLLAAMSPAKAQSGPETPQQLSVRLDALHDRLAALAEVADRNVERTRALLRAAPGDSQARDAVAAAEAERDQLRNSIDELDKLRLSLSEMR